MEEARVIGELAKTGGRPKRTIVFAAGTPKSRGCSDRPNGPN
jgi:hypothetical protein